MVEGAGRVSSQLGVCQEQPVPTSRGVSLAAAPYQGRYFLHGGRRTLQLGTLVAVEQAGRAQRAKGLLG